MHRTFFQFTCFVLVISVSLEAQIVDLPCGPRTDRAVYPAPPLPPLPAAGEMLIDPTFCTTILRVTDESDGQFFANAYSYWPTFNRDNSRIFILRDEDGLTGIAYRFNPAAMTISNKESVLVGPTPDGDAPRREDAIWSGLDPDIIYCHSKLNLWAYDVSNHTYSLVRNFDAELIEGYLKQMSRSIDDNGFAFTTTNRRFRDTGSLAWLRDENRAIVRGLEPEGLDEVQIDKTAQYLVIKTGAAGDGAIQVRILDLQTGAVEDLTDGPPDYAPGHGDLGRGTVIGYDNWLNRMRFRRLSEPHSKKTIFNLADDWTQDIHVSFLADDESWVLYSLYAQGDCEAPGLFHNEIILMRTDGSEAVRRLAHHRSCVNEYWDSPRANISRDGRFVAFTSNWGGANRRDVFILRVAGGVPPKSMRRVPIP